MSSPASLEALIERLQGHGDRVSAVVAELAREIVPEQIVAADMVVGLVWGTVDLDRTTGAVALPFVDRPRDGNLGAFAASVRVGSISLFVEEPSTEGRLAANLVRFGESIAAIYVGAQGQPRSAGRQTPFGRQGVIRPYELPWGPFVIEVNLE